MYNFYVTSTFIHKRRLRYLSAYLKHAGIFKMAKHVGEILSLPGSPPSF